jgi:dTDP-glucose 4,6-dehydratase
MTFMKMRNKVLVTGADGFIGSHLTEELVLRGYDVKALVQYNSFNSWGWLDSCSKEIREQIEVIPGDIRDLNSIRNSLRNCDAVLHLAALIAIPYSYYAPEMYVDTNVKGTLNVLQAAREFNLARVVHTSTSEVYGTAKFVPITEEHVLQGQSPSFNLPVITIRPFNTYGPRQSARAVIPTIISQIANGAKSIKLGSTQPTRDFSYVSDTVNGFIAALESNKGAGEVVNLGSNFEISIGDTAALIASEMNSDVEILEDLNRLRPKNSEVERLWADNTKARELLSWEPKYVGLEGFREGIAETVKWFTDKSNLALYKSDVYNI